MKTKGIVIKGRVVVGEVKETIGDCLVEALFKDYENEDILRMFSGKPLSLFCAGALGVANKYFC